MRHRVKPGIRAVESTQSFDVKLARSGLLDFGVILERAEPAKIRGD